MKPKRAKSNKVGLSEIAKAAGVSQATVGFILSGSNRYKFRQETIDHVKQVAESMNYRPNIFAKTLSNSENRIILCIVGDAGRYSDIEHVKYLEKEFAEKNYNLLVLFLVDQTDEQKIEAIQRMINLPAGIIIWSLGIRSAEAMEKLTDMFRKAPPTISMTEEIKDSMIDYCRITYNYKQKDVLLQYAKSKKIDSLVCALEESESKHLDLKEFSEKAAKMGISVDIYTSPYRMTDGHYYRAGQDISVQILASGKIPSIIYCISDEIAFVMIEIFREHGFRVPEDMEIIGGGDSQFSAWYLKPLPVLVHDFRELSQVSCNDLVDRIQNGENHPGSGRCVKVFSQDLIFPPKHEICNSITKKKKRLKR